MNFKCLFKTQHTYVDFTNGSLPVLWNFKLANDVAVVWPAVLGGHLCGIYLKPTHTYTIHARSYKNHIQSFSWFFLITVTSSPLAMGFTARTIIVPSLVCKNHDVRKGLQLHVIIIIVRATSTHQHQHQHQVKKNLTKLIRQEE